MGSSFTNGGNLTNILMVLIRILSVTFIIGIMGAIFSWVKNNVFTTEDKENIKSLFAGKAMVEEKQTCTECGKEIKPEWKLCPHCGKETAQNTNNEA